MINQSYGEKGKMTVITMSLEKETWEFEKKQMETKKTSQIVLNEKVVFKHKQINWWTSLLKIDCMKLEEELTDGKKSR